MYKDLARIVRTRVLGRSAVAYAVAALILWPVPLFNVLHVESCAVLSAAGFFVAGLGTIRLLREGHRFAAVLLCQVALLVLPLALLTISVLWAPNCSYASGLLFFGLFPVVSVILAGSLAFFISCLGVRRASLSFVCVAAATMVIPPIYDVGLFPQLYTYNHVFGGILGPIYDEVLAIRPGLFAFRGLSLLWAVTLWLSGRVVAGSKGLKHRLLPWAAITSVGLIVAYWQSPGLGWNTTHEVIRDTLGRSMTTQNLVIHYDGRSVREGEIESIADEMEYRYSVLSAQLNTSIDEPVRVYLYPTETVKGNLTGSRTTSVAPVWLRHPQVHMLMRRGVESFDHELVHVFGREFGVPVIRASPSVGLVEGLAAALEAPDGRPAPSELMEAVIQDGSLDSMSVVQELTAALGAFGFWTGRGAVSYAATGSFVRYLLDKYGVSSLKEVYRSGDFVESYGTNVRVLAAEWYSAVRRAESVSAEALPAAEARFSIPSLFETECPHAWPAHVEAYQHGVDFISLHDTLAAEVAFGRSVALYADYLPARVRLASIRLRKGDPVSVLSLLSADTSAMRYPQAQLLMAAASAMADEGQEALRLIDQLAEMIPAYEVESRLVLKLVRGLAVDSEAARWYFSDSSDSPMSLNLDAAPLAPLLRASRALRREDDVAACDALTGWSPPSSAFEDPEEMMLYSAQVLLWRAESCARLRPDVAAEASDRAAEFFARTGHRNLSRYATDRAGFARWKLSSTDGRTISTM